MTGSNSDTSYQCDQCDYSAHDMSNFSRHLKDKHETVAPKSRTRKTGKFIKQMTNAQSSGTTLADFRDYLHATDQLEDSSEEVKSGQLPVTKRPKTGQYSHWLTQAP